MNSSDVRPSGGSADSELPTWRWLCADQAGVAANEPGIAFDSQQAAEDWLREQFQELADDGVAAVTLMDGEHVVYGPMSLAPDGDGSAGPA